MSYVYKEQSITDTADAFSKIIAELVSAGWTLYDDISSTSKVYSSNGETGTEIVGYEHVYISSTDIYFKAWLYWDNVGHSGTCSAYGGGYNRITIAAAQTLYIAGSKDLFFIRGKAGTGDYNAQCFGHVPSSYYTKVLTTLTAGATAGDGATLTVADSSNFVVESEYQIVGLSEGRDKISVSSKPDGTHIVVINLPRNYASGASIGICPMMFCNGGSNAGSWLYPICPFNGVGTAENNQFWGMTYYISVSYADPSKRTDRYILQPISITESSSESIIGYCSENIFYAPTGTEDDLFGVKAGAPINGDVGSSTANTLTDGNKTWSADEHVGRDIVITDGLGAGQVRTITTNSATQVTVANTWTTNPDATSTYSICDDIYVRIGVWPFAFKVVTPLH